MASASAVIAGERAACTLGRAGGNLRMQSPWADIQAFHDAEPIPVGSSEQGILNLATEAGKEFRFVRH